MCKFIAQVFYSGYYLSHSHTFLQILKIKYVIKNLGLAPIKKKKRRFVIKEKT